MAYTIIISGSDLIDALEDKLRNVYENINEGNRITRIQLHRGDEIEIVIGEEEEED